MSEIELPPTSFLLFLPKFKVSALEALKEPNLRLLSDLLSSDATADEDLAVDVNKAYAEEKVTEL